MATSRTGTSTWKNLRLRALRSAKRQGITKCPECSIEMDFEQGRTPQSAEVDHILAYSRGGKDEIDNVRVICRKCNQSLGNKTRAKVVQKALKTSRNW